MQIPPHIKPITCSLCIHAALHILQDLNEVENKVMERCAMNMVIGAALGGVAGLFHGAILLGIIEGAAAGAAVFWIDQNNGTLQHNWVSVSPWYMYRASILSQVGFLSLTAAMNFSLTH